MTDAQAVLDPDRLPWLTSDARPRAAKAKASAGGGSGLVTWGGATLLLVAGGAYWLGRSVDAPVEPVTYQAGPARETMTLPAPAAPPEPTVERAAPVEAAAPPPVAKPILEPAAKPAPPTRSERAAAEPSRKASRKKAAPRPRATPVKRARRTEASAPRVQRAAPRRAAWPAPATAVHLGRMIRLGSYNSPQQVERAWQHRLRRYPQLRGLPRVVAPYRAESGKTFYRLHVMTTARAQSNWICRKIRADWRTCGVLRPAGTASANG